MARALRLLGARVSHQLSAAATDRLAARPGETSALGTCRCAPRRAAPLLIAAFVATFAALASCGSDEGCQLDFAKDAVSRNGVPWICAPAGGTTFEVVFLPDGTGSSSTFGDFDWEATACRTVEIVPAGAGASFSLDEVGGNVEVGRLTFVLDGATVLCDYGIPPP